MRPGFDYEVQPGDCISSIAEQYGFYWRTLWEANAQLKSLRKNPNVLFPGDIVKIPDQVEKNLSRAADQPHTFVKKGSPAKFRLIVERHNVPLANRRYILEIDGKVFEGRTDGKGLLEVGINPAASTGHLRLPDDQLECALALGHLDPLAEVKGVQQRLQNLGFLEGEPDGEMNDDTRDALMYFQSSVNLPPTGDLDDATRDKLLQMQDEVHPQRTEESEAPADAANSGSGGPEEIAAQTDPAEDEAEMARFTSLDD